jgi:hypothetical protein
MRYLERSASKRLEFNIPIPACPHHALRESLRSESTSKGQLMAIFSAMSVVKDMFEMRPQ